MREIYLDNSATTAVFPEVAEKMVRIMTTEYGNPSSMHHKGVEAEHYIRDAKDILAGILKVNAKEILFTSGGTESDNLAIIGAAMAGKRVGDHLITTKIEHPAVLETFAFLEKQGFRVTYLSVDEKGLISLKELEEAITEKTLLVSIMHTNNEIGSVMPIQEAGELIKRCNPKTLFHVDAVQGFGKAQIYPKKWKVDMMSVSAHKIHGPKGIGFLYLNEKARILPIIYGGGQQKGMRSGTENVPGIYGMAMAAGKLYADLTADREKLFEMKKSLIEGLKAIPDVTINGPEGEVGAPHIVSASFAGIRSEVLLHTLEDKGIYVSAGSACASNKPHVSETLLAIGLDKALLDCTIRFSFSVMNTKEDVEETLAVLESVLPMLRRYTRH